MQGRKDEVMHKQHPFASSLDIDAVPRIPPVVPSGLLAFSVYSVFSVV